MEQEFIGQVLNVGGAGVGVSGLLYALYVHFTNRLSERDKAQLARDAATALANAERDKRLEIAQLKNELHEQRLNIQGEFIDNLANKLDRLTDAVSSLTSDVKVIASHEERRR